MKTLLALILVITSLAASAQQHRNQRDNGRDGRITTRDGRTTVRINVGNDRDANQNARIRNLEEAVRDLQAQVYDLQDAEPRTRIETRYVCSLQDRFGGKHIGKALTNLEAEADAHRKCIENHLNIHCTAKSKCERVEEEIAL